MVLIVYRSHFHVSVTDPFNRLCGVSIEVVFDFSTVPRKNGVNCV